MLSAYRPLFRQAAARRLVASSLSARLAVGVFTLPLVLVAEGATGSYALAGLVTGTWDLGVALSAPLRGRLVDRVGTRRAIPPLTLVSAGALGVLPLLAQAESAWLLVPAALLSGLSMPPFVASMRLEWQALLGAGDPRLAQAYAFESSAQVGLFVIGPLLAAAGVALVGAGITFVGHRRAHARWWPGVRAEVVGGPSAQPGRHGARPRSGFRGWSRSCWSRCWRTPRSGWPT